MKFSHQFILPRSSTQLAATLSAVSVVFHSRHATLSLRAFSPLSSLLSIYYSTSLLNKSQINSSSQLFLSTLPHNPPPLQLSPTNSHNSPTPTPSPPSSQLFLTTPLLPHNPPSQLFLTTYLLNHPQQTTQHTTLQ